jgi:hypothetical protein
LLGKVTCAANLGELVSADLSPQLILKLGHLGRRSLRKELPRDPTALIAWRLQLPGSWAALSRYALGS